MLSAQCIWKTEQYRVLSARRNAGSVALSCRFWLSVIGRPGVIIVGELASREHLSKSRLQENESASQPLSLGPIVVARVNAGVERVRLSSAGRRRCRCTLVEA